MFELAVKGKNSRVPDSCTSYYFYLFIHCKKDAYSRGFSSLPNVLHSCSIMVYGCCWSSLLHMSVLFSPDQSALVRRMIKECDMRRLVLEPLLLLEERLHGFSLAVVNCSLIQNCALARLRDFITLSQFSPAKWEYYIIITYLLQVLRGYIRCTKIMLFVFRMDRIAVLSPVSFILLSSNLKWH